MKFNACYVNMNEAKKNKIDHLEEVERERESEGVVV